VLCVRSSSYISQIVLVTCSVLQGCVLGLYTADLASEFGINLYKFANNSQLHVHCDLVLSSVTSTADSLERYIIWYIGWRLTDSSLMLRRLNSSGHSVNSLTQCCGPPLMLVSDTTSVSYAMQCVCLASCSHRTSTRQAHNCSERQVLLSIVTSMLNTPFTWRWKRSHSGSCVCH